MNKVDPIRELVINKVNDFLKEKITSEELEKIFFYSSIDYTLHTLSISRRLLEKEKINKIVKLMPSIQREKERNTYLKNNNHLDVLLLIYNLTKVIKSWFFENYLPKNLDINKSLELLNLKIDNFRIRGKLDIIKDESEIIENLNQLFNKNGLIFKIVEDYNIFKKSVITKGRSDFFLIWIKNMFFEEIIEKLRHLKIKVYSKPNLIGEHTLIEILKKGVHKNSYENLINLLDENIKLQKKIEEKTIKFKKIFTNLAKNIKEKNVEIDMISDDYEAIVKQNCYDFKLNSWILNESDLTIIGIGCNIINNGYSIINNTSEKTLDLKNIEKAKEAA
ncbi:MAG TPA: hypothetical protein VN854_00865, partial [Mycoplasmatales bacterium]|nr:hypothetical protein [Mycoplasmatales bacterium]